MEHLTVAEYMFFSNAHEIFSEIGHMLSHKTSLNKFKRTEIIQNMFCGHNERAEINNKEIWEVHNYVEITQHTPE